MSIPFADLQDEFYENFGGWKNDIIDISPYDQRSIKVLMKDRTVYLYGRNEDGSLFLNTISKPSQE